MKTTENAAGRERIKIRWSFVVAKRNFRASLLLLVIRQDFESTNISRGENFAVAPNNSRQCVQAFIPQELEIDLIIPYHCPPKMIFKHYYKVLCFN